MEAFEALHPGDPERVGPYRIVARLGAGGMGHVYLGQSRGGRAFAVKVVRPELAQSDDFRRRFVREVTSARRVNGVFTAGVVDADPEGPTPWLATAYVPGISLDQAISTHGPWPEESTTSLAAALAEALEAIHAAGVVHRDLKPSNVLLAADGPRVIDFGISLAHGSDLTAVTGTGEAIGTPGFMSPEQLMGHPVGPASDVFSLGAVLALVATGSGPFGTGSLPEVTFRIAYRDPDLGGVPPRLREVVARCLAKDPELRPSVGVLLDELAAQVNGGRTATAATTAGWLPPAVARDVHARSAAPELLDDATSATAKAGTRARSPLTTGVGGPPQTGTEQSESPAIAFRQAPTSSSSGAAPGIPGTGTNSSGAVPDAAGPGSGTPGTEPGFAAEAPFIPQARQPFDSQASQASHAAHLAPQPFANPTEAYEPAFSHLTSTPDGPSGPGPQPPGTHVMGSDGATRSSRSSRRRPRQRGLWLALAVCSVLGVSAVTWVVLPHHGKDRNDAGGGSSATSSSGPESPGPAADGHGARHKTRASGSPSATPSSSVQPSDPPSGSPSSKTSSSPRTSSTPAASHEPPPEPTDPPKTHPSVASSSYYVSYGSASFTTRGTVAWRTDGVTVGGSVTAPSGSCAMAVFTAAAADGTSLTQEISTCDEQKDFTAHLDLAAPKNVTVQLFVTESGGPQQNVGSDHCSDTSAYCS